MLYLLDVERLLTQKLCPSISCPFQFYDFTMAHGRKVRFQGYIYDISECSITELYLFLLHLFSRANNSLI